MRLRDLTGESFRARIRETQMTQSKSEYTLIAKRYAKALSAIDNAGEVLSEMREIAETINSSEDLRKVISNPTINKGVKLEILREGFKGYTEHTKRVLKILLEEKRFEAINNIIEELQKLIDEKNRLKRVEVISAIDLTESEKGKIESKLEEKLECEIRAEYKQEREIIGGLIIRIGDRVIDNSIRTKLLMLNKEII